MTPDQELTIRLSDRAQSKIRSLASGSEQPVRVYAERSRSGAVELALAFDEAREDDVTVAAEGVTVVADPGSLSVARGGVIDYDVEGFVFAPGACDPPRIAK